MKNILIAVDFSDVTQKIISETIKLAAPLNASIRLIHVAHPSEYSVKVQSEMSLPKLDGIEDQYFTPVRYDIIRDQIATQLKMEHSQLLKLREQLMKENINTLALLIEGNISDVILNEIETFNADLVILGSHGHGALHKALVGSITNSVLKKTTCPVLIIPSRTE